MNILTIDTATDIEFISVTTASGNTFEFKEDLKMSHSVTMFSYIQQVLDEAKINIKDIDIAGVGIGPGSFTGVRIAVSTARMIAQILAIPLVGVITQDIYANSAVSAPGEKVLVAFDAKKSRVFASLYQNTGVFPLQTVIEAGDYSMDSILENLKQGDSLACTGDGCIKYADIIEKYSRDKGYSYRIIDNLNLSGKSASRLVTEKYSKSPDRYRFYGNTIPFYARKSDAETAKEERDKGNNFTF